MKVALVHDYLTQRGGAERVVLSLHRLFPDAPIYTSVFDADGTFSEFAGLDVRPTFLQHVPHQGDRVRWLLPLYPAAFESLRLRGYDLVISSSSGWAHGVHVVGGAHLCYCYNPARWLYQTDRYLAEGSPVPPLLGIGLRPVFAALRRWDRAAARRPDRYVAISRVVAERISETYGRAADVVFPPVHVGRFAGLDPDGAEVRRWASERPYFLVLARLLPYKRIDLAVRAAVELGARLVIVGEGPAETELRGLIDRVGAGRVALRSAVSDRELAALLAGCAALVQPGEEDFGLVPLEANAAGRPAVAFAASGALETVRDGETGVLFAEQSVPSLVEALRVAQQQPWDRAVIEAHARSFGEERFHAELAALVSSWLGMPVPTP